MGDDISAAAGPGSSAGLAPPGSHQVHLWSAGLDGPPTTELGSAWAVLADDETDRARRFRFDRDRRRYVVGRAWLRRTLGRYVGVDADRVRFEYLEHGKPVLAGGSLRFNLAHSEGRAALAVTSSAEVGVDLEALRPGFAEDRIAERFFAPAEVAHLRGLPVGEQRVAFFECWTRKEAFLKAHGGGLSVPLDAFVVRFAMAKPAALLRSDLTASDVDHWALKDVSSWFPGCIACVAVRDPAAVVVWQGADG